MSSTAVTNTHPNDQGRYTTDSNADLRSFEQELAKLADLVRQNPFPNPEGDGVDGNDGQPSSQQTRRLSMPELKDSSDGFIPYQRETSANQADPTQGGYPDLSDEANKVDEIMQNLQDETVTPPPSDPTHPATPEDNLDTLYNGDATGDPPDDLTLPDNVDVQKLLDANDGLLGSLNKYKLQDGKTGVGDALAKKFGYDKLDTLIDAAKHGDKNAQNALGKVAWAAQACNNVTEEDGALRPEKERHKGELAGYTSKREADNGSPAGIMQDYLEHGQSITDATTKATARTYADGTAKSNATIVGEKIAGAFKKALSFICPPMSDLIQMAEDGATKIRDQAAGDEDAAHHDSEKIKQDGKTFGEDFGMQAVTALADLAGPEAGAALMAARTAIRDGVKQGVKDGAEAGEKLLDAGKKGVSEGERSVSEAKDKAWDDFATSLLKDSGESDLGSWVRKQLTDLPKDATREEKKAYIKDKLEEHLSDILDLGQSYIPQDNNQQNDETRTNQAA